MYESHLIVQWGEKREKSGAFLCPYSLKLVNRAHFKFVPMLLRREIKCDFRFEAVLHLLEFRQI